MLIYNAAFMQGGRACEISATEAVEHFKVDVAGAIHCVQQLNAELKDKGIFVGVVQIMGVVGSSEHLAPKNIADAYWQLYCGRNSFEYIFD